MCPFPFLSPIPPALLTLLCFHSFTSPTFTEFYVTGALYVVDDCWSVADSREEGTNRLIPDPEKFPSGISWLADEIHDMGLRFGIYADAGSATCAGYPG